MIGWAYSRLRARLVVSLRAVVSLLMLVSFGLANFGYPVWEPVVKGDQPFPCQFSRCGCQTAEQCRQSCCCHSKQERVAWAVERGIDPDRVAVLTADEKFEFTFAARRVTTKQKSCCQTAAKKPSCCSTQQAAACCEAPDEDGAAEQTESANELRWVLAIAARKCKGTGVDWIQAGFVAQPPPVVSMVIELCEAPVCSKHPLSYFSPFAEPLLRPV